jgi:GTP-binding protein
MQIHSAEFVTSATGLGSCPEWERPEIALIGRSNVGKSSLINFLTNRKGLAKVSATPGKTRLLNFFLINQHWSLVDLPGYGYAKASKAEKFDFNALVGDYLDGRENLRQVMVLIDSRHEAQRIDLEFISWLTEIAAPFSLIFTKCDKQSPTRTQAHIAAFMETATPYMSGVPPQTFATSVTKAMGRREVLAHFFELIQRM